MYYSTDAEYEKKPKPEHREGECCTINIYCNKSPFEKYSFLDKFNAETVKPEKNECYEPKKAGKTGEKREKLRYD